MMVGGEQTPSLRRKQWVQKLVACTQYYPRTFGILHIGAYRGGLSPLSSRDVHRSGSRNGKAEKSEPWKSYDNLISPKYLF